MYILPANRKRPKILEAQKEGKGYYFKIEESDYKNIKKGDELEFEDWPYTVTAKVNTEDGKHLLQCTKSEGYYWESIKGLLMFHPTKKSYDKIQEQIRKRLKDFCNKAVSNHFTNTTKKELETMKQNWREDDNT